MPAREVWRAVARDEEPGRAQATISPESERGLVCEEGAQAVTEQRERTVEERGNAVAQGGDQRADVVEQRLAETTLAAGKLDRTDLHRVR